LQICRPVCAVTYLKISVTSTEWRKTNWKSNYVRQCFITARQSNSAFSSRQHTRFHQLTKMDTAFTWFESARLLSLGYLARTCLWRKATWTVCEPERSSECYQRQMACCRRFVQSGKLWKRRLEAVAKQNGGPIQHIFCWSVDWLMITVAFWCSLRTSLHNSIFNSSYVIKWHSVASLMSSMKFISQ